MNLITDFDIHLFREGTHGGLYRLLGAHPGFTNSVAGFHFAVWAPNAADVHVVGNFNHWDGGAAPLEPRPDGSGLWSGFIAGAKHGDCYKYRIRSKVDESLVDKGDPFALAWEKPPATGSRLWSPVEYEWHDSDWMARRGEINALNAAISIYEVHLGSWMRPESGAAQFLNYREIAPKLADHVQRLGFTHIELMPITEHPFYGSWGYQTTGYFAPTARYGTPEDFMALVDHMHQRGIGVILDWVPSHFPGDEHGLHRFDGTSLYEHADARQGFHPEWKSYIFNYGRNEVRAFLRSSAMVWLDRFHVDGLRVDAVASMLYLDYGRKEGEWIPNVHGGKENLEAVSFLRELNTAIYAEHPDVQVIAEESTAWPGVSRPTYVGGLGFGMKWNMGWMHDTLSYMAQDPINRRYHQDRLTFGLVYAFSENFVLPLSHDEVVYGKKSLLEKMPGDDWQKFANLRLLLGQMWAHPGKKLLFMGSEFGQRSEWAHESALEWSLLQSPPHQGIAHWVSDLNRVYKSEPALHSFDFVASGFEWIDMSDVDQSVLVYQRKGAQAVDAVVIVCNFTPVVRRNYQIGVPVGGVWNELLNSDAESYGGSGVGNFGQVEAAPVPSHGHFHSLSLTLPPLAIMLFKKASSSATAVEAPQSGSTEAPVVARPAAAPAAPVLARAIASRKRSDGRTASSASAKKGSNGTPSAAIAKGSRGTRKSRRSGSP